MPSSKHSWGPGRLLVLAATLLNGAMAADVLSTVGLTNCGADSDITVHRADISYDHSSRNVTFDLSGTSKRVQNVTAELKVTAYGQEIFSDSFNPCSAGTFVAQLCPVPSGTFGAAGSLEIPKQFADMVPGIAFQVPDIAALAKLELKSADGDNTVACIQSQVSNGKTANLPVVSYVAAGIAGTALVASGVSAIGSALAGGGAAGGAAPSPSFGETIGWFQSMAMNGMLSVSYPPVYSSFTKNFAFSAGLIPWTRMQVAIDDFRRVTGGDLTKSSVETLRNTTLIFADGSTIDGNQTATTPFKVKRAIEGFSILLARQIDTSIGGDTSSNEEEDNGLTKTVEGITAYVERLGVPESNTFMTALLILAIVIAAIVVGILLVKVVLEFWALFGNFPKSLAGFREHYWRTLARAITSLILLLYGIWVIYCVYQFSQGDSWAAQTLAGVTLALFTGTLAFFTFKIWYTARQLKKTEGDSSGLYDKKEVWIKYSHFYESYKKDYWWLFVPIIIYMLAKGVVIAAGNGHGLTQASIHLGLEVALLVLLIWKRPFERKSGNVINITIQVVRVLSIACILVFVERFGIAQTTQTVTGVVLIAVQAALTGLLAILICWNAINSCCKANPHRQRRKEMEKRQRDMDTLTPLDARNSLLLDRKDPETGPNGETTYSMSSTVEKGGPNATAARATSPDAYDGYHRKAPSQGSLNFFGGRDDGSGAYRALTPTDFGHGRSPSHERLVQPAAPIGRQPTLPNVGGGWGPAPRADGYGGQYNRY
ncbi:hypothetical protein B0T11DRAFT_69729 [Plectosphaerella cucumerina]|uniref:ML-like domain-containing protein n=1 Tax=Plectosphaerella cucumerina TaxID=40658 RepID=A0A8K0TP41_9PEZI|nr:hypothetical protein B0T11DRAFT_69729 [Plectosphaerella cucumerina]